jgi:hypothetical protein
MKLNKAALAVKKYRHWANVAVWDDTIPVGHFKLKMNEVCSQYGITVELFNHTFDLIDQKLMKRAGY